MRDHVNWAKTEMRRDAPRNPQTLVACVLGVALGISVPIGAVLAQTNAPPDPPARIGPVWNGTQHQPSAPLPPNALRTRTSTGRVPGAPSSCAI